MSTYCSFYAYSVIFILKFFCIINSLYVWFYGIYIYRCTIIFLIYYLSACFLYEGPSTFVILIADYPILLTSCLLTITKSPVSINFEKYIQLYSCTLQHYSSFNIVIIVHTWELIFYYNSISYFVIWINYRWSCISRHCHIITDIQKSYQNTYARRMPNNVKKSNDQINYIMYHYGLIKYVIFIYVKLYRAWLSIPSTWHWVDHITTTVKLYFISKILIYMSQLENKVPTFIQWFLWIVR